MHWRRNLDKTAAFLLPKVLKFQVKGVFGPVLNVKCKTGLASDQNIWQSLFYDPVDKRVAQYPKIRTTPHFLLLPTLNILQNPTISYNQVHPQQASFLQSSTLCVPTGYYQATPWYNTKLIVVTLPILQFLRMRCCPLKRSRQCLCVCELCAWSCMMISFMLEPHPNLI